MLNQKDKQSLQNAHGLQTSASNRDASQPLGWRKGPTIIATPTNAPRQFENPFTLRRVGANSSNGNSSNPNKRKTLAPALKRRKIESAPTSQYFSAKDEVIDMSTSTGRSSPDPLLMPGHHSGNESNGKRNSKRIAPDGQFTASLRAKQQDPHLDLTVIDSDDGIQSASGFEEEPVAGPSKNSGLVKSKIAAWETGIQARSKEVPPEEKKPIHLDLALMKSKNGNGNGMKPRKGQMQPKNTTGQNALTEAILNPSFSKQVSKQKSPKLTSVPVKTMFRGTECIEGNYTLDFGNPKTLVVKDQKGFEYISFQVDRDIDSAEVSNFNNTGRILLVVSTTKSLKCKRSRHFRPGEEKELKRFACEFDIRFQSAAENIWKNGVGAALGLYLKAAIPGSKNPKELGVTFLDGNASRTMFGLLEHASNRHFETEDSSIRYDESAGSTTRYHKDTQDYEPEENVPKAHTTNPRKSHRRVSTKLKQTDLSEYTSLRRSARQSATSASTGLASKSSTPPADVDELILVYPPVGTGAVNITRGDLNRLQPGQYLNDTLIEFGLKLWLNNLREMDPELADQVHVFSSFFYKKLNIKDKAEGLRSVRKWTQKVDIFKKKYIVVPINENLHWYLAIIYQPEYTLSSPPPTTSPEKPHTRKRKRESDASSNPPVTKQLNSLKPEIEATASPDFVPDSCPHSPVHEEETQTQRHDDDEREVEKMVMSIDKSCSISDLSESQKPVESYDDPVNLFPSSRESPMDVDLEVSELAGTTSTSADETIVVEDASRDDGSSINTGLFYAPIKGRGKPKAVSVEHPPIDVESDKEGVPEEEEIVAEAGYPHPWIFTFDSLNGTHPGAINHLQEYLKFEAEDKKSITEVTKAMGKKVQTPIQTNYCDCGVYLIHFVRTFMKDPEASINKILKGKKRGLTPKERAADWDGDQVKHYRQQLREEIVKLQDVWKQVKQEAEKAKAKEDENSEAVEVEDSDVEIIEGVNPPVLASADRKATPRIPRKKMPHTIKKPVTVPKADRLRG